MYCYKFPDRATFQTLAAAEGLVVMDEDSVQRVITDSHTHSLDEVGTIYEGGTYDAEGEVITPPVAIPGHHVNTQGLAPEAWDAYLVVVNTAARVFCGGSAQAPSDSVLEQLVTP